MLNLIRQGKARVKHQAALLMELDDEEDTNEMKQTSKETSRQKKT